jgi:ADP-heptose:LPS heptosyltransferase
LKTIKKVLVLNHQGIGNVIENIPLLTSLKKGLTDTEIWSTVSSNQVKSLIENLNIVDDFYVLGPSQAGFRRLPHIIGLRKERFDLLISTPGSDTLISSVWAILIGARFSIGEDGGWKTFALKKTINPLSGKCFADLGRQMVRELGINPSPGPPVLNISPEEDEKAKKWIASNYPEKGPLFIFHPGCDANNPYKRWPSENYRELWQMLKKKYEDAKLLVMGSVDEEELVKEVLPSQTKREKYLAGQFPLREVIAIAAKGDLLVSADSGWMHLGAAVNLARVSIFGPTSPDRCRPDSTDFQKIISVDCPDAPCYPDPCNKPCLSGICASAVAKEVIKILEEINKK